MEIAFVFVPSPDFQLNANENKYEIDFISSLCIGGSKLDCWMLSATWIHITFVNSKLLLELVFTFLIEIDPSMPQRQNWLRSALQVEIKFNSISPAKKTAS